MGFALHFGPGIGDGYRKTHTVHHHDVGQVVTHIRYFVRLYLRIDHDLFEDRDFFDVPLVDVIHTQLARAFGGGKRVAPADDAGANTLPLEPLEGDAVLRVEAFGLDHPAIRIGEMVDVAAGQNAIHVHEQQLDFPGAGAQILVHSPVVARGARRTPYNRNVIDRVAATLEWYGMLPAGTRVGVAVSGGADSVFLLLALRDLNAAACVLHINHRLRGEESDRDEAFVRELAHSLGLPCHVAVAPPLTGNTEQEARRSRYGFFTERLQAGACDAIATGHTLDDQAETVLYRFVRGAGTAGLSGILPVVANPPVVRPLLGLRREEIRTWLRERNIMWREDHSNSSHEFARNRIRLQHMPELANSLNPALPQVLASTAEWAQAEEEYWTGELDRLEPAFLTAAGEVILIRTGPFGELPVALQRRLLRRAIGRVRGSLRAIGFQHVEAMRALMATREGSGRIQLPDLDIYRSFDWLRLAPTGIDSRLERNFQTELLLPGRTELPERALAIETELVSGPDVYNDGMSGSALELCAGSLVLRNWRPGDRFHLKGTAAAVKIKTLFQDFRIPLWERRSWPVITLGDSILWTRGFGVSSEFAATRESPDVLLIRELNRKERESNTAFGASTLSVGAVLETEAL